VTDAVGHGGERYGFERLCEALEQCAGRSAPETIEGLTASLSRFQTGAHADDTAVLVVRRR
jgi:serine phosphatase RsbU (regulator of sigma subunit)